MTSTTRNRFGGFGMAAASSNNDNARPNKAVGSAFANGGTGWNNDIWANSTIGSGLKGSLQENGRTQNDAFAVSPSAEGVTGSKSLLPSSESDDRVPRHSPWQSTDNTSPILSKAHSSHTSTSPMRRQKSNQYVPQPFAESNPTNPLFFMTPAPASISSRSSQKNFLDSGNRDLLPPDMLETAELNQYSRQNSDEGFGSRNGMFGNNESGHAIPPGHSLANNNTSGYSSSVASRSGSLPPSRSDIDQPTRSIRADMQNIQYSRYGPSSSSQRSNASINAAPPNVQPGSTGPKMGDQLNSAQLEGLSGQFDQLHVNRDVAPNSYASQRTSPYINQTGFNNNFNHDPMADATENWIGEEDTYHGIQDQFSPTGSGSGSFGSSQNPYRGANFVSQYNHSPSNSDTRLSHHSPFYSTASTPPTFNQQRPAVRGNHNGASNRQATILSQKLQNLQQQQNYMMPHMNPLQFRNQVPNLYHFDSHNTMRMNPLQGYYPVPPAPHLLAAPPIPRGPARDHDVVGHLRSQLLEEFRNNSKTNKRYELKDIYDHIVEFSGDQHGSRFIQQKLETANSDEKDQVFRELQPNARQLMTDVFGNYVIQKFFEHGNQAQKKMLANQMKNHVLTLSTQMYGCRVVQKALEHILTDQQAQLVGELEHDVLRCVKDQNGNHVVQKAIERVPAEHIQFIINAFTGQVQSLATHPYGCRVIQRMLEHCEEPTRSALLQELHLCASHLITDQYGNYVTQHVIEHGRADDRGKIVSLITQNLVTFSRHKFASNVVEKSIQFGSKDERQRIVRTLTVVNDKGDSPVQALIRDQYGNYVVQKLLTQLKGAEWEEFAELVKPQIALLKRYPFGKQIAAVEKLLYSGPSPPQIYNPGCALPAIDTSAAPIPPLLTGDTQSPESVSHPSTHASSADATTDSRKSSEANGPLTPTSTHS